MGCLPRMERGLIVGIIVEAIVTGILTGGVYALMASGLTLVFGVMDIINIGQGALVILGAYLSYVLEQNLHIDLFLGLLITMPVMFILAVILLGGLYLLLYRTGFGYSLRASMADRTAAELIGIDVERVSAITFGIGVALAAAGGVAFGATNLFNPSSHYDLISRLLVIIVLGGLGSLRGALIASVALLVIGDVTAVVWSPVWSSTVFFIILIAVLVIRPQGLFGQPEGRKQ